MQSTSSIVKQHGKATGSALSKKEGTPFFKPVVQPKLTINQTKDVYEQEADAVADKVMRMTKNDIVQTKFFRPTISSIQRKCAHCEEEEKKIQRKDLNNNITETSRQTENYIKSLSGGKQLNKSERNFFEPRFGHDFSNVKIHTDTAAARSASSINAMAYTSGSNIVFNEGQHAPCTDSGKKLLAHELTHVVQQSNASTERIQTKVVDDDEHLPCRATAGRDAATLTVRENEAAAMAVAAAAALRVRPLPEATRRLIWKRFRLDYNDGVARCYTIPTIADRFATIADTIRNTEVTYKCTNDLTEPTPDCAQALGVTQSGIFNVGLYFYLCSSYWSGLSNAEQALTLLHEWAHFDFASRGLLDEQSRGFDTAECYNAFATEITGGAITGPEDTNCVPNPDPLPALNQAAIEHMPCPGNVFANIRSGVGYSRGIRPGRNYLTVDLGLDYLFPITTMHDWEFSIGARLRDYRPTDPGEEEAFAYGARVGVTYRYRPWRFGYQIGVFGEAGGINVTQESGARTSQPYVGGGVTAGLNFSLSKNVSLQLFGEVAGKAGLERGDAKQFGAFEAGIGAGLTIR